MKAILISIQPKWTAKILNGEKTIEVRKRFPLNYRGWVYIYCTKGNKNECLIADLQPDKVYHPLTEKLHRGVYSIVEEKAIWNDCKKYILNGKVVARFYCDNVKKFDYLYGDLCKLSCLFPHEICNYLQGIVGYAIHISQLEIFDKPKELSEFYTFKDIKCNKCKYYHILCNGNSLGVCHTRRYLTKAPQSWQFIEVEE